MNKLNKFFIVIIIFISIVLGVMIYIYINEKKDVKINSNEFFNNENEPIIEYRNQEVYSIKGKEFYLYKDVDERYKDYRGMKLLEYDNSSNDYAEIYYIYYDYSTDPSFYYTLEITDESNNNLLIDGEKEQQLIGGMVSIVRIKKLNLKQKFKITVFEKYTETNNVVNSSEIQIDLGIDLEEKVKINQSDKLKDGKLGDVNFKYIDDENIYFGTIQHAYSKKLTGENCSLPVRTQYGNRLISEEHIEFSYITNVNNLNLEEAFESMSLINDNLGQYGLSDIYGMSITNEQGEIIDTVIVNFYEMINLCNGLTIKKDGKEYSKKDFDHFAQISMIKIGEIEIANGIKAIKYCFEFNDICEYYLFVYNDNIYTLKIPKHERLTYEVQEFLDNLEISNVEEK